MDVRDSSAEFEWNSAKAASNHQKHGISFAEARAVFDDPLHLEEEATEPHYGEWRTKAIGRMGQLMVTVIYTERHHRRRIISARRARRDERERYRRRAEAT